MQDLLCQRNKILVFCTGVVALADRGMPGDSRVCNVVQRFCFLDREVPNPIHRSSFPQVVVCSPFRHACFETGWLSVRGREPGREARRAYLACSAL